MAQHVQILGILHIINGVFTLVVGGCAMVFLFFGSFAIAADGNGGEALLFFLFVLVVGGLIVLAALPGVIGGFGALSYQRWARILLLIVGAISLLSFPFGTALGIYTFWVLLNNETEALFS
jgi:hypothetical protein